MAEMAEMAFTNDFLKDEVCHFTHEREMITACPTAISAASRDAKQQDLRDLQAAWISGWLNWGSNPDYAELIRSLKFLSPKMPEISKILCLGLGTLGGDPLLDRKAGGGQAITQHMFAINLTETLRKLLGTRIPLMACDFEYSENDKTILSRNAIEVVRGCVAVNEIDSKTLVVYLNPSFPLEQMISDLVKPAAIIWDQAVSLPETTLRVYYDKFFTAPLRFGKTNVAIRKPIIDNLANAIETELELPKTNGMAKHGYAKTHMDDMDGMVIVEYEPEDEWVFLK
uniref:SRR1-like domain-containing protein n=1 Tax=Bionectria ochroleuca TaxID=29856 RepID=A0A8H7KC03_BIOOC